jgi:hypothetical protein
MGYRRTRLLFQHLGWVKHSIMAHTASRIEGQAFIASSGARSASYRRIR